MAAAACAELIRATYPALDEEIVSYVGSEWPLKPPHYWYSFVQLRIHTASVGLFTFRSPAPRAVYIDQRWAGTSPCNIVPTVYCTLYMYIYSHTNSYIYWNSNREQIILQYIKY